MSNIVSDYPSYTNGIFSNLNNNYGYLLITSNSSLTFYKNINCDILVIGAGGRGGSGTFSGGGGAGEIIYYPSFSFSSNTYNIQIGIDSSNSSNRITKITSGITNIITANGGGDGAFLLTTLTSTYPIYNISKSSTALINKDVTTSLIIGNNNISMSNNEIIINSISYYQSLPLLNKNTYFWGKLLGNTNDSSGNNYNFISVGTPIFNSSSVSLSSNNYLTLSTNSNMNLYTIWNGFGITISLWAKLSSTSGNYSRIFEFTTGLNPTTSFLIYKNSTTTNIGFRIVINNTVVEYLTSGTNYFNDTWFHIIWSISPSGNWKIYINNILLSSNLTCVIPNISYDNKFIGRSSYASDGWLVGEIKDFRIYRCVLNDTDVSELYYGRVDIIQNATSGGSGGGGYYNSVYSFNKFIPKTPTSTTTEVNNRTLNSITCYGLDITLDNSGITYGSGTYSLYYSSIGYTITSTNNPFSIFNYNNSIFSNGGHFQFGNYNLTTGIYSGNNYLIDSNYTGDWIVIKFPSPIIMNKYKFTARNNLKTRAPKKFRIYGSNDGISWTILDDVDITNINLYINYIYEKEIINIQSFTYYCLTVNQIFSNNSAGVLNLAEIEYYEKIFNYNINQSGSLYGTPYNTNYSLLTYGNDGNYSQGGDGGSANIISKIIKNNYHSIIFNNNLNLYSINYQSFQNINQGTYSTTFNNGSILINDYSYIKPWGAYFANDWYGTTLFDSSGNGRHATTSGIISKETNIGNGASAPITYITGGTSSTITWPTGSIPTNFTILGLTRYNGGTKARILISTTGNWLHGHHTLKRGVAFYEGWKTNETSIGNIDDWLCCIGKNGGTIPNNILIDGTGYGVASGGTGNYQLSININNIRTNEYSDWALSAVIIYNSILTDDYITKLNNFINNYKSSGDLTQLKSNILGDNSYPILKETILNYTDEREYPPKAFDTSITQFYSSNDILNIFPTTYIKQIINLNTNNITYGSGDYIIYSSSITATDNGRPKANFFNKIYSYYGGWGFNFDSTNSGYYITSRGSYIKSDYKGEWIIIELPDPIILTKYIIYNSSISRAPSLWRFYGSIDGINWNLIVEASNDVNPLINTDYINGSYQKILSPSITTPYKYLGFTVNKVVGNDTTILIAELVLFGKEIDEKNINIINPTVWYKFDNPSNIGKDEMKIADMINNNGTLTTTGIKGNYCVDFNGVDQYLSTINFPNLNNISFSICCWCVLENSITSANTIFGYNSGTSVSGSTRSAFTIDLLSDTSLNMRIVSEDLIYTSTTSFVNQINFWCFTFDTSNSFKMTIYLNGIQVATRNAGGALNILTNPTYYSLGRRNFNSIYQYANVRLDDFRVYTNKVLSLSEVQELYYGRIIINYKFNEPLTLQNFSYGSGGSGATSNSIPIIKNNYGDGGDGNDGFGFQGAVIIKFPFENSIGNSNFSSNLLNIIDKDINFPYWNDIKLKPSFCNICFSANFNDIFNKPNSNSLSTLSNLYYSCNSYYSSLSNINYSSSNNLIIFNNNKLNNLNSSLWNTLGNNIYSNLGSIGIGTSSFGNNKLSIKGILKADNFNLKGNSISNILITSNTFDNKSNNLYTSVSNINYNSSYKQITSSQFTSDTNKNLFINNLSNYSYYSNSFSSASLSSNSLLIPIKSQIIFNYSNQYLINSGTYNILFDNGNIITNYNSQITDKSYPILKDTNGNNINPYIWYKFDNSLTNILIDSSGNNFNLTNNGATFDNINYQKGNGSVSFNYSSSQYLSIPSINLYNIQSVNGISFCLWFKMNTTDTGTYPRIFDFNNGNTGTPRWILLSRFNKTNQLCFDLLNSTNSSGNRVTTNNYIDNTWHHVIWCINNVGSWTVYIDGSIASFTATLPTNINIENLTFTNNFFGKSLYSSDGYLLGNIDDFRIYNSVLTPNQVNELYNGRIDLLQQGISYGINAYITGTGNTINIFNDNINYRYALFISNGTFVIDTNITCDILVVGGGGGGGVGGGGGGAGAVLYTTNFNLSSGTYSIVVGSGGAGSTGTSTNGINGNNSSITINSTTYTAVGGGGGGTRNDPNGYTGRGGNNGGSGGGGSHSDNSTSVNIGGISTKNTYTNWTSLGNSGGEGKDGVSGGYGSGGGGGAGSVGANAGTNSGGNGGTGVNLSSIFGTAVGQSGWFGGGGGAGSWSGVSGQVGYGNGGNGLLGGGGNAYGQNGIAYTGGGGGGADFGATLSGAGGNGVVIIRYLYSSSTIKSNSNSLVLSSNSIIKFNYSNDTNINIGTYNVYFSSGSITINSNFINDKSYPILKDISGNNINPNAWYKFDDTTNLGKDEMNTYNLTNNNGVSYNTTDFIKGSGSSSYNGTNQSLSGNCINLNNKSFNICGWFKCNENTNKSFYGLYKLSNYNTRNTLIIQTLNFTATNYSVRFSFYADDLDATFNLNDNLIWNHFCFTYNYNNNNMRIYKNGVKVAEKTSGGSYNSGNTNDIYIIGGTYNYSALWNGKIDDFRIYTDFILSDNQVKELYNGRVDIYSSSIYSSNVGIGTTNVSIDTLTIAGNLNVNEFLIKKTFSSNLFISSNYQDISSNNIINYFNSKYLTYNSSNWITNNSSIYFSFNGNIGIGSIIPKEKLDINGNLNINGKILPNSCNSFDIGSSNKKFRDLYLSGNSIYLNDFSIKNSNNYLSSSNININQITLKNNINGNSKTISLNTNGDFMISNKYLLAINDRSQLSNIVFSNVFNNSSNYLSNLNFSKFNSIKTIDNIPIGSNNRFIINDTYNRSITLTGITQSYNLITSNLNIIGDYTNFNTTIYQTEQLFIANSYNNPSMIIKQMNVNKNVAEFYTSNLINTNVSISGTGNTINTATDNSNYKYAFFSSNGNFTINNDVYCDILIVGGGGSGGGYSGGGGGGDVIFKSNFILKSGTYSINIGNGGIAPRSGSDNYINGNSGETSSITSSISNFIPIYAAGGGGGIGYSKSTPTITPTAGSIIDGNYSSGGGGGAGSDSQNYSSGSGNGVSGNGGKSVGIYGSGGGGGATGNGGDATTATNTAGIGGSGFTSIITGTSLGYGGGGGGSSWTGPNANSGTDGGGNGGRAGTSTATDGLTNRGGGGGGAATAYNGGNGGSGVVIIRYAIKNMNEQIRFLVNSNGNVGIGTNLPSSKLNVIGTINSTGLIVNNNDIINQIKINDSNYSNSILNSWNYSNNLYINSSNYFSNISNSKQNLLNSSSILLGIGSNICNLNYSNVINKADLSIYSSSVNSTSNSLYSNLSNINFNSSNFNINYVDNSINNLVKYQWNTIGNNVITNSNVGIGSTIPSINLDINGNLNTNELIIKKGNISNLFITSNIFDNRSNNYYSSFSNQDFNSSNSNIIFTNNIVSKYIANNNTITWNNGNNSITKVDFLSTITSNYNSLVLSQNSLIKFNYTNDININSGTYDININGGIGIGESPYVRPWGAYFANDWSGTTLLDSSGNGRHATTSSGNITKTSASGNGATGAITYISGGTGATISWPSGSIPANYTIVSLTRYTAGSRGRILTSGININWLHGHHVSKRGVAYYDGWKTNATSVGNLDDWLCFIGKNGGSIPNNFLVDGVASGTVTGGSGSSILYVNLGQVNGETSDWALSCVLIYDSFLSDAHMVKLNNFINTYKSTGNLTELKSNILRNIDYSYPLIKQERQYPPKSFDSSTSQTTVTGELTNILPTTFYKETITINSYTNGYGIGDYTLYSSSMFDTTATTKKNLFDYNNSDGLGHWVESAYTQPNGTYAGINYIKSDYKGDWIVIKLPNLIILSSFIFYIRSTIITRSPALWKCYGSMDGITFTEIIEASNSLTALTSTNYSLGYYQQKLTTFSTPYLYIGFTFNKLVGGDNLAYLLNFSELQLFGRETNSIINPIAWYKFDNNFLTTDSSGNNKTLTNNNNVLTNTTDFIKGNGCAQFNGTNYFQINEPSYFSPNNSFSISLWMKLTNITNNYKTIFSCRSTNPFAGYTLYIIPGSYNMEIWIPSSGGAWNQTNLITNYFANYTNIWKHLTLTFNKRTSDNEIKIYLDGVLITTVLNTSYIPNVNYSLRIGAGANETTPQFYLENGSLIDDFRFYNFVLTQNQVNELYNGRVDIYSSNNTNNIYVINNNLSCLDNTFFFGTGSINNTIISTTNSLVLPQNTIVKFNNNNETNLYSGTYDINFNNGGIGIGESPYVRPWGAYFANDWSGTTLLDSSGNGRHATTSGTITKTTASGNGATGAITYINGGTGATILWPLRSIPANYTILSLTRYNSGTNRRILGTYGSGNWLHGHWSGQKGVCHYNTGFNNTGNTSDINNWVCTIGKNNGVNPGNILVDGVAIGIALAGNGDFNLCVNSDIYGETSDWALSCVLIYDSFLSDAHMVKLNNFINTYKSTGNLSDLKSNIIRITDNSYPILKDERQYPPKLYNSITTETTTTEILGKTSYKQTFTLNTTGITYGSGDYIIYSSSVYTTGDQNLYRKGDLFNFNSGDIGGHWANFYSTSTGLYTQTNFIKAGYLGDWIIIKLPVSIILSKFRFYYRISFLSEAPSLWKCYGSTDGITFNEIIEASNDTIPLTTSSYDVNRMYEKVLLSTFNTFYNYIGFTFNGKIIDASQAYFCFAELQLFGRETININDINPTAWYKFDVSTNIGLDSSGNGYNLTNTNSVTTTPACVKGILASSFNTTNYLTNTTFSTNLSQKSFSISYFQYAKSTTNGFSLNIGSTQYWFGYGINNSSTYGFGGWSFSDIYSSAYNDINLWVHVCYTYNVSTQSKKIYRNGLLIASGTGLVTYTITDGNLTIGYINGGYLMNGNCDDFRIYNGIELTESQIQDLYKGRVDVYNINNNITCNILTSNFSISQSLGSLNNTITSTCNSLVLSQNSLARLNNTNDININNGSYNVTFNNGFITINSNLIITNKSYPILKDTSGNNINPTAWYKFDDSTNLGRDEMNTYNLTNYNSVGYNSTNFIKGSGSASFDGAYSRYLLGSGVNINSKSFSISFWVYPTNLADVYIYSRYNNWGVRQSLHIGYRNSTNFTFALYGDDLEIPVSNHLNNWNFFTLTYNVSNNEQKAYINGTFVISRTSGGSLNSPDQNYNIGRGITGSNYISGYLDDFRIYSGLVLTQSQVSELYNGRVDFFQQGNSINYGSNVIITGTGNTINNANDNSNYKYAFFSSNGTFTIDSNLTCDILVVGGGASGNQRHSGGGGAGALIYSLNQTLTQGTYTINIGSGGLAPNVTNTGIPINGTNGNDTEIILNSTVLFRAKGGGYGSGNATNSSGGNGGSGGGCTGNDRAQQTVGSAVNTNIINGVSGFICGNSGGKGDGGGTNAEEWSGGGGGGAGYSGFNSTLDQNANTNAGNGGDGIQINITGIPTYYAGGGGGGISDSGTGIAGFGGLGGGGKGSKGAGTATSGTANTGGGGGGGGYQRTPDANGKGGDGGSGVVIIRYLVSSSTITSNTNSLILTNNSIVKFNYIDNSNITSGTYNINFLTGAITINQNYANINSFPILKDANGNIINPLVWYKFDKNSFYNDSSGNNNNLINVGSGGSLNSNIFIKGNSSASFNTTANYFRNISIINNDVPISFSYWFYANNGTNNTMISYNNNAGNPCIQFDFNNTTLTIYTALNNQWTIGPNKLLSINTWYHVVYTLSNTNPVQANLYVNGLLVSSGTGNANQTLANNRGYIYLGYSGDFMRGYNGLLDDFRIYNFVLTSNQIQELYNGRVDIYNFISTSNYSSNLLIKGDLNINGNIKINNTSLNLLGYNINVSITGTGNTINTVTNNSNFKYAFFANNGTFTIDKNLTCDILVVGGGGSGGYLLGGGGGGGSVVYITNANISSGTYNVVVGAGGAQTTTTNGNKGNNSSFAGIVAEGGGYSVSYGQTYGGGIGGSGGGAGASEIGVAVQSGGTVGTGSSLSGFLGYIYGNKGGSGLTRVSYLGGGGGGGAGGIGVDGNPNDNGAGGKGGNGILINITGTNYYWGAGGGGAQYTSRDSGVISRAGAGGLGGGGGGSSASGYYGSGGTGGINNGTTPTGATGGSGGANTGSGGGGGAWVGAVGGAGGSGVVIIRYNINQNYYNGAVDYSNIQNRPYLLDLFTSSNIINVGINNNINLPLSISSWKNEWLLFIGTSPTNNIPNSFIFHHLTPTINSKWWFNGTRTSTNAEISDNRIKKDINDISNGLDKLMLIKPKEYFLCDDKDYHKKYGIIAQDIYQIPELNHFVYKDNDYIANIYSSGSYDNSSGIFIINSLKNINNLIEINDEIKIILNNQNPHQEIIIEELPYQNRYKKRFVKVKRIIDNYNFEIFNDIELNEIDKTNLFIYGKKINDFHKLDYNSLYTLNIKANQEIYNIINKTYNTLDNLTTRIKNLENKLL